LTRFAPIAPAILLAALMAPVPAVAQTLEQMAGQMIVVGFAGDSALDKSVVALRKEIAAGTLGGVMYLRTNVASLKAVAAMNAAFRAASPELPPFSRSTRRVGRWSG
jgi:beta-N-acetylhexosaminidase